MKPGSKLTAWWFNKPAGTGAVMLLLGLLVWVGPGSGTALGEPNHAIAMHGSPALPADFKHLPYVNPEAPKGGEITYGVQGTFDSLNPFIVKSLRTTARGVWDPEFGNLVFETLLFRSRDEPFSLYGLLAEKVELAEDRSWMEFHLNPKARWSDGMPVTPEDVLFTYELLTEKGRPPYSSRMDRISAIRKTGDRSVRFDFNARSNREFPLIIGLTPVLPKHAIEVETFDQSTLVPPIGSGPYLIDKVEAGQRIRFKRNPDYWAKDLPVKTGFDNYDAISIEYFRDANTRFEAFKKGIVDVMPEGDPAQWRRAYEFPAIHEGKVVKDVFINGKPANMFSFVFNTRRPQFSSVEVRKALAMLFDFEWTNKNIYYNAYQRTGSFWHGSQLSALGVPASDQEKKLLAGFPDAVSKDVMEGTYKPAVTDGTGRDRKVLRAAFRILKQAGFKSQGGQLLGPDGVQLSFEILCKSRGEEKLALAYQRPLKRLGIDVQVRTVDDAQYQRRIGTFDYDMILFSYSASLSPGIEQRGRWTSESKDIEGSFNFAGAANPAVDHMVEAILQARSSEAFVDAVRALDRVLISGHYVVPLFHVREQWVARWKHIQHPPLTPLYGYQFSTWWDQNAVEN